MSNQNKMSKEYFWGDVLSGNKKEIDWNPSLDDEDEFDNPDGDGIQHFLFLKQAVLGPTAEGDERNVVEIKTENFDGDDVTQPLFSLKLGLNESCPLDIGVQPPVTFILSRGAGPVYLSGQHMIEISADDDDEDLEEEEEDDVDVQASPDLLLSKNKKRPLSTSEGSKKTKMAKLDKDAVEEEQDEDDEDEEDADMAEMDDDDDDEEDEDFEGDEDEDEEDSDEDEEGEEEDDDEDEEEEEDEESPEKPVKKTKGKKSQMNGTATAKGDNKPKVKGQTKVPKPKGKKKMLGIDEIKEKIQASSNVPKKEEKFKNYLRSSFHISEPKKLQDLWGWYRGSLQK